MAFHSSYANWYQEQLKGRHGEGRRRLEESHGHGEKLFLENVWYPAFRQFDDLYPEYEVSDFRDGSRFLDFAFLRSPIRLAIEIDGFGPHYAKINRWQFSDHLTRQNHLIIDGWQVLRFSYDDVNEKPRMCIQLIQQFMGAWGGEESGPQGKRGIVEDAVLRMALRLERPMKIKDVCEFLQIHRNRACELIGEMVRKELLLPVRKGGQRVHFYSVNADKVRAYSRGGLL